MNDPTQLLVSRELLDEPFPILPTVLLETVWVLRASYGMPRVELADRLRQFIDHENANVVSAKAIEWAVDRYRSGLDFADMVHVALAAEAKATRFATFDKGPGKAKGPPIPVETLSG